MRRPLGKTNRGKESTLNLDNTYGDSLPPLDLKGTVQGAVSRMFCPRGLHEGAVLFSGGSITAIPWPGRAGTLVMSTQTSISPSLQSPASISQQLRPEESRTSRESVLWSPQPSSIWFMDSAIVSIREMCAYVQSAHVCGKMCQTHNLNQALLTISG